jgi:hypothetical protein
LEDHNRPGRSLLRRLALKHHHLDSQVTDLVFFFLLYELTR